MSRLQHTRSLSPGRSLDNQRTQNQRPGIPCMLLCDFGPLCRFFASFFVPQPLQPASHRISLQTICAKATEADLASHLEAHQFHPQDAPMVEMVKDVGRWETHFSNPIPHRGFVMKVNEKSEQCHAMTERCLPGFSPGFLRVPRASSLNIPNLIFISSVKAFFSCQHWMLPLIRCPDLRDMDQTIYVG